MMLIEYVRQKTDRCECNCGRCFDRGDKPDPTGHAADLVFFKVVARDTPTAKEFIQLTKGHRGHFGEVNPLDGVEHSYLELGGWIGDQGLALQYMGLGALLGVFKLLTPYSILGATCDKETAMVMAGAGYVTIMAAATDGQEAT